MWTEELALDILRNVNEKDLWYRVIALDFETRVIDGNFLTGERILAATIARRQTSGKIDVVYFILEEETDESEALLLSKLDSFLKNWNPLIIVGYGCRSYDLPLLSMKKRFFEGKDIQLWNIANILRGSIHIELLELSRFIFHKKYNEGRKYRKMIDVMNHEHFNDLPFTSSKDIYNLGKDQKGIEIYENWKTGDEKFVKYLEGEAHDQLLIAERIRDTEI